MADVITLTIEDTSVETVVQGTEMVHFIEEPGTVEFLSVVDGAPDHGQLAGTADDDHPQYVLFVVAPTRPGIARPGTMWIPGG